MFVCRLHSTRVFGTCLPFFVPFLNLRKILYLIGFQAGCRENGKGKNGCLEEFSLKQPFFVRIFYRKSPEEADSGKADCIPVEGFRGGIEGDPGDSAIVLGL